MKKKTAVTVWGSMQWQCPCMFSSFDKTAHVKLYLVAEERRRHYRKSLLLNVHCIWWPWLKGPLMWRVWIDEFIDSVHFEFPACGNNTASRMIISLRRSWRKLWLCWTKSMAYFINGRVWIDQPMNTLYSVHTEYFKVWEPLMIKFALMTVLYKTCAAHNVLWPFNVLKSQFSVKSNLKVSWLSEKGLRKKKQN